MRRASAGAKASYREAGWWVFRACPVPRYGVVHHQHYPLLVGIVLIHQFPYHPGPIGLGATVCHCHPPPPFQGREQHEQVAHPVALVLVIVDASSPRLGRTRQPGLLHPRSWPRAGSAVCWSRPGTPELPCPHTGDGRLPARLPWRTRTRLSRAAGSWANGAARNCTTWRNWAA